MAEGHDWIPNGVFEISRIGSKKEWSSCLQAAQISAHKIIFIVIIAYIC